MELETTAPEGVYALGKDTPGKTTKYVVLTGAYGNRCCLYVPYGRNTIMAGSPSKTGAIFKLVEDAEVIFEIKE